MKVILFGATGMIGQGVLKACLADDGVAEILAIGRTPLGESHAKLKELHHTDFSDFSAIESQLSGYDACYFCLGVSSAGMSEEKYRQITYGFTMAAAQALSKLNPNMTFIYISGMGADSTEKGSVMWARVRGKLENDLLKLPFKAYVFRPGGVEPMDGIQPKNKWLKALLKIMGPFIPLLKRLFPDYITSTRQIGKGMLEVTRYGSDRKIFECKDINRL